MNILAMIKEFLEQSKRVITISKKPDWKEFSMMVKVTTLGILLLALIGFIVILFFTMTNLGA